MVKMGFQGDLNISNQSSWNFFFKQSGRNESKVVILKQQSMLDHQALINDYNLIGKLIVMGKSSQSWFACRCSVMAFDSSCG